MDHMTHATGAASITSCAALYLDNWYFLLNSDGHFIANICAIVTAFFFAFSALVNCYIKFRNIGVKTNHDGH